MNYLPANTALKIPVDIRVDGEFSVPSSDISVSIMANGIVTETTIPQVETSTVLVDLITPAVAVGSLNYITLIVSCNTAVSYFRKNQNFAIFNYADLFTDADAVRRLLGLKEFEYLDSDFDLEGQYLRVLKLFKPEFTVARSTDQYLNKVLGDVIALSEAIRVAPTLMIKLADKEETENGKFDRWGDPKYLADFIASLKDQLYGLLDGLEEYLLVDVFAQYLLQAPTLVPMFHQATGDTT